jgi:ribosome biogenesis protein BMS1
LFAGLLTCHATGKGNDVGVDLVKTLQNTKYSLDEKLDQSFINYFGRRPAAQSEDSVMTGNNSSRQNDQGDKILEQVGGSNISADTLERNEHSYSECSSDSEGDDADDIQPSDHGVDLREKVEFCNGRIRRKAVSANFQDNNDDDDNDEVYYYSLVSMHIFLSCFAYALSLCSFYFPSWLYVYKK